MDSPNIPFDTDTIHLPSIDRPQSIRAMTTANTPNPYEPTASSSSAEIATHPREIATNPVARRFRFRVIPATLSLFIGILYIVGGLIVLSSPVTNLGKQGAMASSWLDWFTLIATGFYLGVGISLLIAARCWMRAQWLFAIAIHLVDWIVWLLGTHLVDYIYHHW